MKLHLYICCLASVLIVGDASAKNRRTYIPAGAEEPTVFFVSCLSRDSMCPDISGQWLRPKAATASTIYKKMMAGEIMLGSVLQTATQAGVPEFAAWVKKNNVASTTVGEMGVFACVTSDRSLTSLSLKQLREILTGKITTWDQLGDGSGKLTYYADATTMRMLPVLLGIKPSAIKAPPLATKKYEGKWSNIVSKAKQDFRRHSYKMQDYKHKLAVYQGQLKRQEHEIKEGTRKKIDLTAPTPPLQDAPLLLTINPAVVRKNKTRGIRVVAITADAKSSMPVWPRYSTIRDKTYPLSFSWRAYVHPTASELVKGVLGILTRPFPDNVESNTDPREMSFRPINSHEAILLVSDRGHKSAFQSVASSFQKRYPECTLRFPLIRKDTVDSQIADEADLLLFEGDHPFFWKQLQTEAVRKSLSSDMPTVEVGKTAMAVLVHPSNPISSIQWKPVTQMFSRKSTTWDQLGANRNDAVFWVSMGSSKIKKYFNMKSSRSFRGAGVHARGTLRAIEAAAENPNSLLFLPWTPEVKNGGLKTVALVGPKGEAAVLPSAKTMIAGTYPAVQAVRMIVRGNPNSVVRKFLRWLDTPEGVASLQAEFIFPVGKPVAATQERRIAPLSHPASWPAPAGGIVHPVTASAAIMPTSVQLKYYAVSDPAAYAYYEDQLYDALERAKLTVVVDRQRFTTVLKEREMALLSGAEIKSAKVADIFLFSKIIRWGGKPFLRIHAVSSAQGSLLGELYIAISPANTTKFTPTLAKQIQTWWPGVVQRYRESVVLPRWELTPMIDLRTDLSPSSPSPAAQKQIMRTLSEVLDSRTDVFISRPRALNEVHQERLFSMMGITQSDGVRFSPLVDTVIAAELTDDQTLKMNVYDVKEDSLKLTETISLSGSTEALKSEFRRIVNKLPVRKSETVSMSTAELDVLAKKQARRLVRFADEIGEAQDAFAVNAVGRQARAGRRSWETPEWTHYLQQSIARQELYRRASVLDPTWDTPAFESLRKRIKGIPNDAPNADALQDSYYAPFAKSLFEAEAFDRFWRLFPKHKQTRGTMEYSVVKWSALEGRLKLASQKYRKGGDVPANLDPGKSVAIQKRTVDTMMEYTRRYQTVTERDRSSWWGYTSVHDIFLSRWMKYLLATGADDAAYQSAIRDYVKLTKPAPKRAVHRDFLELWSYAMQNDKPKYLKKLAEMQTSHPNRKSAYWNGEAVGESYSIQSRIVRKTMSKLFGVSTSRNTFNLWFDGKRGPGDLPYIGYNASKDRKESKP